MKHFSFTLCTKQRIALLALLLSPPYLMAQTDSQGYDEPLYDQPIITSVSQLYCNAAIAKNPVSNLIDGNLTSYLHTFFNGYTPRPKNPITENHFIRVYAPDGLPEQFIFTFSVRNSDGAGCQPTKIALMASNDSDKNWVPLDTVSKEAGDFSTDGTTYTLKNAITGCEGYKYLRWECLAVNTNYGNTDSWGHCYFVIGEFQLYPCKHYNATPLSALLESYFSPDAYQLGSYVGQVTDTTAYNTYYDTYLEAQNMSENPKATADEQAAMSEKLTAAKNAIDASLVPLSDGLYYVVSAYTKFTEKGKPQMGWYSPLTRPVSATADLDKRVGWAKLEKKTQFMWQFKKLDDGNYYISNNMTGKYLYKCVRPSEWTPSMMSDSPEMEQLVEAIAPNGQHKIHAKSDSYYLQAGYTANGDDVNTYGEIYNWYSDMGGDCTWYIIPVTEADKDSAAASYEYDRLQTYYLSLPDYGNVGTDPGQVNKGMYEALVKEKEAAAALLAKDFDSKAKEEYKAEYERLCSCVSMLDSLGINAITDGYYAIVSEGNASCLGVKDDNVFLNRKDWNLGDPRNLWKITAAKDGSFHMQNVENGRNIGTGYGWYVQTAPAPTVKLRAIPSAKDDGSFYLSDDNGLPGSFYNSGTDTWNHNITALNNRLYRWYFINIPAATVDSVVKVAAQTALNDSLRQLIIGAESLLFSEMDTTVDFAKPLITDASQLYGNAPNGNENLANLLSNDNSFYHGAYNRRVEDVINDYHYLRAYVPAGLPDKFAVRFRRRSLSLDPYGGLMPTQMEIYAAKSLDEGWTYITTQNLATDYCTNDSDAFVSKPVTGAEGYKYLRWVVKAVNNNYKKDDGSFHPYAVISFFNLYPVSTGDKSSKDADTKAAVSDLTSALDKASSALKAGKATEEGNDALRAAIDAFNKTVNGSAVLEAALAKAKDINGGMAEGTDPFTYPAATVESFSKVYSAVLDKEPYTGLTSKQKGELASQLEKAVSDAMNNINKPDSNTWYYLIVADQTWSKDINGETVQAAGRPVCQGAPNKADGLCFYWENGLPDEVKYFGGGRCFGYRFIPTGKPGEYFLQNVGTGYNLGYLYETVTVRPLGEGQIALFDPAGVAYGCTTGNDIADGISAASVAKDSRGAFQIEPVASDFSEHRGFLLGALETRVNPYTSVKAPSAITEGAEVHALVPSGYKTLADGKTITELHLTLLDPDAVIPAGTPYILKIGRLDDFYDADIPEWINTDFFCKTNTPVSQTLHNASGMVGTFIMLYSLPQGAVYFEGDSAVTVTSAKNVTLTSTHAYVDPSQIAVKSRTENEDGTFTFSDGRSNDLTVYFKGGVYPSAEPVGIATVKTATRYDGSVWTTDGVLLRRGVRSEEELRTLPQGIYIYGGKKINVR